MTNRILAYSIVPGVFLMLLFVAACGSRHNTVNHFSPATQERSFRDDFVVRLQWEPSSELLHARQELYVAAVGAEAIPRDVVQTLEVVYDAPPDAAFAYANSLYNFYQFGSRHYAEYMTSAERNETTQERFHLLINNVQATHTELIDDDRTRLLPPYYELLHGIIANRQYPD